MKFACVGCIITSLLLVCPVFAFNPDAPRLTAVSITPATVDVSTGSSEVQITTGNPGGFRQGSITLYSVADGYISNTTFYEADRKEGTVLDGRYEVLLVVPQYAIPSSPGNPWRIAVRLYDQDYKENYYDAERGTSFPVPADATFAVTNTETIDSEGPSAANIQFSPESVSMASGEAVVSLTFDVLDSLTGFDYGYVYVTDSKGVFREDLLTQFTDVQRTSGDAHQGSYEVDVAVPAKSPGGIWSLELYLHDGAGNYSFEPVGEFMVTSAVGTIASALDAAQYSWTNGSPGWKFQTFVTHDGIDAAASSPVNDGESATFETSVTGPGTLSFHWKVDSDPSTGYLSVDVPSTSDYEEISGDVDWTEVTLSIPPGEQTVIWSYAKIGAGSAGRDRGWVDEIRFLGDFDKASPVLQSVQFSPESVNPFDEGESQVIARIETSDDYNGISSGMLYLYDPSGNYYTSFLLDESYLISVEEDSLYRIYEVDIYVDDSWNIGDWRVELELLENETDQSSYYGGYSGLPFPNSGEEFFTVTDQSGGYVDPKVDEIYIFPNTVDISSGSQQIGVTLSLSGLGGEIDWVRVYLYNPDYYRADDVSLYVSGNEGTYEVELAVPQYGAPGTWTIGVEFDDGQGTYWEINPHDLESMGGSIEVTNNGEVDIAPPAVTSFQVSSNVVDARFKPIVITVSLIILEETSGLKEAYLYLYDPAGNLFVHSSLSRMALH